MTAAAVPPAPVPPPAQDTESVAGEEDPGSALEQFSDLMNDAEAPQRDNPDEPPPPPARERKPG